MVFTAIPHLSSGPFGHAPCRTTITGVPEFSRDANLRGATEGGKRNPPPFAENAGPAPPTGGNTLEGNGG